MLSRIKYDGSSISSIEALGSTLGTDVAHLQRIALNASDYYTPFQIEKKNGGVREIRAPKPNLKVIQKRINTRIFAHCIFPLYLQGSIRDIENPRDFVSNAQTHSGSKTVISADIENFYPSVKIGLIKEIFKYLFRFSDEVAQILACLTTLDGCLPQGAPTSSYLANLAFYDTEYKLYHEFVKRKLIYTRLIDDITVSSLNVIDKDKRDWIIKKICSMLAEKSLKLHRGKLRQEITGSPGVQVVVTGLWIDRGHPRVSTSERRIIRAMVHNCRKEYDAGHKTTNDYHLAHNSASGKVALLTRLGHSQAPEYRSTLNGVQPEFAKETAKKLARLCRQFVGKRGAGRDKSGYTRRYHKLMYNLSILGRSDKAKAFQLRTLLRTYPPLLRVSELPED